MKIRRRLATAPRSSQNGRLKEVCPICGHVAERGMGRLVDPITRREVCVRCGNEVRKEER